MPGGASLRPSSTRPCKYGPRDGEGRCPKKPKAARKASSGTSTKPSNKRPCKYGPRGADGLCPKKPKAAAKGPQVKKLTSVAGASRQAGEVLRSSKATSGQKREAVRVLGVAVATEAGKKVAESAYDSAKKHARSKAGRESLKRAAKTAAPAALAAARAVPVVGGIAATAYVGGKALTAQRKREAKQWADSQLKATRKRLPNLTADQARVLWQQYYDVAVKKPVQNTFTGK